MNILLTGGGTAGHAWPVVLIAKSLLKNKRNRVLYVGSGGIERELAKKSEIPFERIFAGKRRAYFSVLNFFDVFKTFFGIIQAYFIFIFFKPSVIFAKGGYVTVPIIFWSRIFKTPLVIHESDSVIGRANLWAAKYAKKVCLGFPVKDYEGLQLPLSKLVYTGVPVGEEFFQTPVQFGSNKKVLITGGSQGSERINKIIAEALPSLTRKYEVWHFSGEKDYEKLSKFKSDNYHLYSFSYELSKYLRDADLVITRAGASTLAEISAAKKPAIIIPLSSAASGHQEHNGKVFSDLNAAVVLNESSLSAGSLESIIDNLMEDDKMRNLLGHHAHSLARPGAVSEIIDVLFEAATDEKS